MRPSNCPGINTLTGRCVLACSYIGQEINELRGLYFCIQHSQGWKSCTFSLPSGLFFLRPRIHLCMALGLGSSPFLFWMVSWVVIETNFCSVPLGLLENILLLWNNIVLTFLVCSSLRLRGRNGCPKTPFHFGLDPSSTTPSCPPQWRSAELLGSRYTKLGRSPHIAVWEELDNPSGAEGWSLVFAEHLLTVLHLRCHPQTYGYLLHWSWVAAQQVM